MMEEVFPPFGNGHTEHSAAWTPAVDILENTDSYTIRLDLPGVSPEKVTVELKDNTLTIRGSREEAKEEEGANYHRQERCSGAFQQSFELPPNVNADAVTADFTNGVLEARLPKADEAKPRQVQVRVTGGK
jgi:HSP20 family protein